MPARSASSSSSSKAAANNEKKKKKSKAADVVAAEEDATTASSAATTSTIADVVRAHFDARQRDPSSSSVLAAASALRRDLLSSSSAGGGGGADHPDDDDDVVAAAVVSCLDSAMSAILRSSSSSSSSSSSMRTKGQQQQQQQQLRGCCLESATSAWELAVAFSLLRPGGGGEVPTAIVDRASGYASSCEVDAGRIEACRLLGTFVERIIMLSSSSSSEGSADGRRANVAAASILKRGGNKRRKEGGTTTATSSAAAAASASAAAAPWEVGCLLLACRALSARVTDKIAKVRSAAIVACKPLLSLLPVPSSSSNAGVGDDASAIARRKFLLVAGDAASGGEELAGAVGSLVATLLWLVGNDPSAPNRTAVLGVLPPLASASAAEEEEDGEDNYSATTSDAIVRAVIGRIRDVDVRVREAALDSLRTKVGDFNAELSEDARAEILRTGFSKR
jgi:hypothetical protein